MNRMSLSYLSCKRESYVGGSPTISPRCFCQSNLKCILLLIEVSNLKIYLSSCEVFIKGVSRAVRLFHWTTCQIQSTCRLLGLWDWGVFSMIVAESVFNRLEIVASWFELRKDYGVNPQPTLDREGTSILCGSWDWDIFFTIVAKSVFNRLEIVESWDFIHGRYKLLRRSLTTWDRRVVGLLSWWLLVTKLVFM